MARETRGSTILQLCLYADLLAEVQGVLPERMHAVPPGKEFIDEAGQLSLAIALAVAPAARSVVLLGDPQQLEQPVQGTHPQA